MAGVPSTASEQACDACRKQKKKCNLATPACSRCARLGLTCVGAGRRRYVFKEHKSFKRKPRSTAATPQPQTPRCSTVSPAPTNELTLLIATFLDTIKPSTPVRFNLADTLGPFLRVLPQRLGGNRALDAATRALVSVHSSVCKGRPGDAKTSRLYSEGLAALRLCLCIPSEASSIETVCAVLLLTFCAKFGGFGGQHWTSHCNGAVQLLRLRHNRESRDDFEVQVLQSLRGSVICEVLFNRETLMNPWKWNDFERLLFPDDFSPDWQNPLTILGQIPRFIQMSQCIGRDSGHIGMLRRRIETAYGIMRRAESVLALQRAMNEPDPGLERAAKYACTLSVCCMLNCMVRTFRFDELLILKEAEELVDSSLQLVDEMDAYRPLRASFISLNLYTAWMCTNEPSKKRRLEQAIWQFSSDFRPLNPADRPQLISLLWDLSADMHLSTASWKPSANVLDIGSQYAALTTFQTRQFSESLRPGLW
ncbi:hypothetical protein M409DRAFT_25768 [Zasmidium cellare ATCC 36951]|uniref:Zn(2)-C6 fungal-type domain-containing protein n=1 Tax=Zasmidium cellare ATCC 36951 TaxID=1080233 RepID=A0A6A6CA15_ZASCE|nr:uncharacterized protein M409DRAFT_25768 [Zasmidium cellare ATCC 36951]KAF2163994.1 hypothetical protein M409DRAFT_25768 [Zasmidium cellare ATCC 36951]